MYKIFFPAIVIFYILFISFVSAHSNKKKSIKFQTKSSKIEDENEDISQDEIDKILDKISDSGYSSLSNKEKEKLFNASKKWYVSLL